MREHLGFLKTSSAVVKIAAWVFLFLGIVGASGVCMGRVAGKSVIDGIMILALFTVLFFVLYLIAKIADLLVKIIHEIKKE